MWLGRVLQGAGLASNAEHQLRTISLSMAAKLLGQLRAGTGLLVTRPDVINNLNLF